MESEHTLARRRSGVSASPGGRDPLEKHGGGSPVQSGPRAVEPGRIWLFGALFRARLFGQGRPPPAVVR
jgi:hypothetical protein